MNKRIRIAVITGAAVLVAGCGTGAGIILTSGSEPSAAACKSVMTQEYKRALASGTQTKTEPAACKGLPASTLTGLMAEVVASVPPSGNAAACKQYHDTKNYLSSAGTITADVVQHVTSGIMSAELLATGKLHDDLDVLYTQITSADGQAAMDAAVAVVDSDCATGGSSSCAAQMMQANPALTQAQIADLCP